MSIYLWFPLAFAFLGFLFSSRKLILGFNALNPFQGLLVYYSIIFLTLEAMQWFGLIIGGIQMTSMTQTLGEILIIFAYFIIFDMESAWIQDVVNESRGSPDKPQQDTSTSLGNQVMDCPNVYLQAEDGATYYLVRQIVADKEVARWITFVIIPGLLAFIGILLTRGKVYRTLF